jgi:hypothetical protein
MFKKRFTQIAIPAALLLFAGASQAVVTNIAVNGGFETGNFSGWTQFPSTGTTQSITTVNPSSGTYAANIDVPVGAGAVNNVLKQQRLLDGLGLLSPGDVINFSFDYRGSASAGGVFFVKSICETAGGTCGDKLEGPLSFDQPDWTSFAGNFTLGADVSAYTLEFAAICGADENCFSNYYIDNVVINADIDPIPVPAAVWLFGSGLLGLIGIARKKKAA